MIRNFTIILLSAFLFSCTDNKNGNFDDGRVNSFRLLKENFSDPQVDYSTAPFWVWNDIITKEKIDTQLKAFKDQGIHMVFIHPRPGLITEYLSREWMELTLYAVKKAEEMDMKIWLYDENSFPSGFAGGHVPAMMPESYNQGAGLRLEILNTLSPADSGQYFLVLKKIGTRFANVTHGIRHYYNQPGEFYAFSKWYYPENEAWFGGWSYVDLLAEGVTEKFIKLTMRGYESSLGEDLGTRVPGIFTDEPNINTRGGDPWVIRWTPALFEEFEKKYGYQLQTYLPMLYEDIGDYMNIRHDYYALLLDLFVERWAKPWYEYTESKNLKWTGHYWEHGWPNPKHGGDNMAMYAWHQIPGIDMLFNNENIRPDQFGNIRTVKELSSVANQMGRQRTLSETYGGAGWDLTFEDMKRLGDWEYALGVNFMNQHLSYMTIKGARKRDFPQSMSYHTPWWDNYKPLNDYFHRLSWALSAGEQDNRILIIEPTTTTWMHFSPTQDRGHLGVEGLLDQYRESFHQFLGMLEKYSVEYDLASEKLISEFGKTSDDQFIIGKKSYDLVVFPPLLDNLETTTFRLLDNYLEKGGKMLSFGDLPDHLDGNGSTKITTLAKSYPSQWAIRDSLDRETLSAYFSQEDFIPLKPETWGGRVFHLRRKLNDGQIIFLANFDKEATSEVLFEARGKSLAQLDPLTGEIYTLPAENRNKNILIGCEIPPSNAVLYFIGEDELNGLEVSPQKNIEISSTIEAGQPDVGTLSPNMLTLDYCDLMIAGKTYKNIYFYRAADTIFKQHLKDPYGFNYNPWSVAVQYRTNILDMNRFDSLSGFDVVFPFYLERDFIPDELRAVVEWPHLYHVRINGSIVEPLEGQWWLDRSFGVIDLSGYLREGRNELHLSIHPMDILAELEPVYLTGNFKLKAADQGWIIGKQGKIGLGSWKDQGYPHYSGKVNYIKRIHHNGEFEGYRVQLNDWHGTVAEIWVNGSRVGIIGWKPYQLDISDGIVNGENEISVRVCGSLKNLLGPHHNNPNPGVVTPWSFFYAPEEQPSGQDYDLLDYGLFEDFDIIGYK